MQTQLHTHTSKRAAGRQRPITSCKSLSLVGTCAASEKKWKDGIEESRVWGGGVGWGGRRRTGKAQELEAVTMFFKSFCVLDPHRLLFTLSWPWWQSVWHAVGHNKGQQDKHMAFGIIETEAKCACQPVYACFTLNPLPPPPPCLVTSYRWLARWHGVLLSKQEPTICLCLFEKLFFPVRRAYVRA